MKKEELDPEEVAFQKGFNDGCLITEHLPELATKITGELQVMNGYCRGFSAGKNQQDLERKKLELEQYRKDRQMRKDKDRGKNHWFLEF